MTWREFLSTAKKTMEHELMLRRAQVAAAEDALARIESIGENMTVLEALMASMGSRRLSQAETDRPTGQTTDPTSDQASDPAPESDPAEPVTDPAPVTDPVEAVTPPTSPSAETDPDLTTVTRPLSENIQRTLQIMASAEQPMRAREVVQALGEPDRRSVIESTRTRLKRLVNSGHLTEHEGLFSIAKRVNGHVREGAAPADP